MDLPTLNVIFPMAGDGIRFGGVFKPFQFAGESYFIELAKYRFDLLKKYFSVHFYFVYRKDQEQIHSVQTTLQSIFPNDTLHFCILPEKTSGPLQTVVNAIELYSISGPSFICDCDLSIDISQFIPPILSSEHDYIVSLYPIEKSNWFEWGKAVLDPTQKFLEFCEKENPTHDGTVMGLIGCHFIRDISKIVPYKSHPSFSYFFQTQLANHASFGSVNITDARFFGTPEQLIKYKLAVAQQKTYFIDIDGTLIYTTDPITYDPAKMTVIPGCLEKLQEYKRNKDIIVLTTARKNEQQTRKFLSELNIPFDKLITNISSGQRVLINDKKPYFPLLCTAVAYQIDRDVGLGTISGVPCPEIIKKMYGCSFADVYLLKVNGRTIVRKYIRKTKTNRIHVSSLINQVQEILRFDFYIPNSVPKILDTVENEDEFYYDMEYLEGYTNLSCFEKTFQFEILGKIFEMLNKDVYSYRKQIDGELWMQSYIQEKILCRLLVIEQFDEIFFHLVNAPTLLVNGKTIKGIRAGLESLNLKYFTPSEIQPIHGDLTFENILVKADTKDIKLIDHSGSKYMDSKLLDLGKVFQSLISRYEEWHMKEQLFTCINKGTYTIHPFNLSVDPNDFTQLLEAFENETNIFEKGMFYLVTHLIRGVPYFYKQDKNKATYCLLLTSWYISYLADVIQNIQAA